MEKREVVDQKRQAIVEFLSERAEIFRRQGTVVTCWRHHNGRRLGPYFRLAFRSEGKQQGLYLGSSAQLAKEVATWLGDLQAPLRHRRAAKQQRAQMQAALRRQKREWQRELGKVGLYLKGFEVRGYRTTGEPRECIKEQSPS